MVTLLSTIPAAVPDFVSALSLDAAIVVTTLLLVVYSVVRGHMALIREAISIYVGLVLSASLGEPVYDYLHNAAASLPLNETAVKLFLLLAPVVVLQIGRHHPRGGHKHHLIITFVLAVMTGFLLISSVLNQLDQVTLSHALENSNLAAWIYEFKLVWLGAVPLAIAASAFLRPKGHH
ncbi:MAG TPA: hypothetical protein VF272_00870 [Candidatus Saccharimonadia bacterium]